MSYQSHILLLVICTLRTNHNTPGQLDFVRDKIFKYISVDADTIFIRPD